jgi:hypothetical protein
MDGLLLLFPSPSPPWGVMISHVISSIEHCKISGAPHGVNLNWKRMHDTGSGFRTPWNTAPSRGSRHDTEFDSFLLFLLPFLYSIEPCFQNLYPLTHCSFPLFFFASDNQISWFQQLSISPCEPGLKYDTTLLCSIWGSVISQCTL